MTSPSDLGRIVTVVYARFTASRADTLWYYESLAAIFTERQTPMAAALNREVQRMCQLSHTPLAGAAR